ncbi:AAA family ATPase [Eubacteriales bacterium OttesenSCG-928-A19]|nr:AAA family ATPase [Eubacteriales bacterium OttesenSCG-928-A19]
MNEKAIPAAIRDKPIWLVWRYETVEGRQTKVPYSVHGGKASSSDPATWASFDQARAYCELRGFSGLGIGHADGIAAVDIDHCVTDGKLSEVAQEFVKKMDCYTEYSPSGEGLRLIFTAPDFTYDKVRYYLKNPHNGVEVYIAGCTNRYVTITGNVLKNVTVADRSVEISALLEKYMVRPNAMPKNEASPQAGMPTPPRTAPTMTDMQLIDKINASNQGDLFRRLWAGDTSGHNEDDSAADIALCNILAFWTNKDAAQMDRIFKSSGLYRPKWDEMRGAMTYGQMTIDKAIQGCTKVYEHGLVINEGKEIQTDGKPTSPTQPTEPTTNPALPELEITKASELMTKDFPPLIQAVNQLICEGLTMLVAASKVGKSWLVLLMAVCVALGESFLGRATTRCRVIYFALEDSERRLQSRLRTMGISRIPDNLDFVTKAQMIDSGFLTQVEGWLAKEEGPALVIVDTLQKVRGIARKGVNAYEGDYDVVGGIKALADKHQAMIVCVHHTNKAKNVTDIFDKVSGSTGIMGAADTTILIDRERGQDTATVHFEGRDAWGDDFVIRFENGRWELMHNNLLEYKAGVEYEEEPLVQLFRHLITENPGGGRWAYSKLQAIGLELLGYQPFIDGRDCARKLNDDGLANELRKRDKIVVETAVQTTGGKGIRLQQISPIIAFPTKMQIDDEPT